MSKEGLLGIITNNGYLDNITFRGMRHHLLTTFDKIYILNLHGNSNRKKEKTNVSKEDKNAFDIKTGGFYFFFHQAQRKSKKERVSKSLLQKPKRRKRKKYNFLNKHNILDINLEELEYSLPNYFFTKKDFSNENIYNKGISLQNIFDIHLTGINTNKNKMAIDYTKEELLKKLKDFTSLSEKDARKKYGIKNDSRLWKLVKV